ncbi:MAG: bifunctional phosphopantothenoylcysteine decarboxylase/phosphopantothenate synthase [Ignavibacteria bacterium]|nr:bifunctional phosphopantothenoylcysteine decarboxylase/phosphopantothenate synthase [Ignavibacteria bacterium]
MLKGKKIIVGVSGSISAYKAPLLVRELIKLGAEVHVIMTPSAAEFVSPLVLTNLSKHPVIMEMFDPTIQHGGSWHIHLAGWCDAMIIAPASAATLARIANGYFDSALTVVASALPRTSPLLVAPAMDTDMWEHPAVLRNVLQLERDGITVIPPAEGELASGLYGVGRLPEMNVLIKSIEFAIFSKTETAGLNGSSDSGAFQPEENNVVTENSFERFTREFPKEIRREGLSESSTNQLEKLNEPIDTHTFNSDIDYFLDKSSDSFQDAIEKDEWIVEMDLQSLKVSQSNTTFLGKTILITAGPTYEKIDDVRFVGNYSSGKMGFALASEAVKLGANVLLVAGPVSLPTPNGVLRIDVESAQEMYEAVMDQIVKSDVAILSAAVADYSPVKTISGKIKKKDVGDIMQLELRSTKDILGSIGAMKTNQQIVVGFALESTNELQNAQAKLSSKNCDMIVLNSANKPLSGFRGDDNTITIITASGDIEEFPSQSKNACAVVILEKISTMLPHAD